MGSIASISTASRIVPSSLRCIGRSRMSLSPVHISARRLTCHSDLQRRGCIRTAFEFGRLLYSLEPWTDPHGVLFHLDFVSIKSGMGQWLLDVYSEFSGAKTAFEDHLNPSALPGWAYARALALFAREKAGGGQVSFLIALSAVY
jgi:hypothetical protein